MNTKKGRYRADITAGSLKVRESSLLADLLLRGLDERSAREVVLRENTFQSRSPRSAERLFLLLYGRLSLMRPQLWELVRDGTGTVAAHACLAAAVKHSALLGDFLDLTVRDLYHSFAKSLSNRVWAEYIEGCRGRDPLMPQWSESTVDRLRSSVFQILTQAGYIENTRTLKLQTIHIAREVIVVLNESNEDYVLRCIQVGP